MGPIEILEQGAALIKTKNVDYTSGNSGMYENFDKQSQIMGWFTDEMDKVFACMVGVKLARLSALLSTNRTPNHESIADTFLDLTNYCALWGGYRTTVTQARQSEIAEVATRLVEELRPL